MRLFTSGSFAEMKLRSGSDLGFAPIEYVARCKVWVLFEKLGVAVFRHVYDGDHHVKFFYTFKRNTFLSQWTRMPQII